MTWLHHVIRYSVLIATAVACPHGGEWLETEVETTKSSEVREIETVHGRRSELPQQIDRPTAAQIVSSVTHGRCNLVASLLHQQRDQRAGKGLTLRL